MYNNIVLAFDGSEHGDKALEHAKILSDRFEATLWLVHVFPHTSDLLGYEDFEQLFSRRKCAGQVVLDNGRRKLGEIRSELQDKLVEGPEAEAILTVAENCQADLIVMGTRGLGTLKGLMLGSVSRKVTNCATCPVMVVR